MKAHLNAIKWTLLFLLLAGMCNAAMDVAQFHYDRSVFAKLGDDRYYNPAVSWENKWAVDEQGRAIPGQERFPGSSTVFVKFTDFWHLAKSGMIACLMLAVVCYRPDNNWRWRVGDFLLGYAAFTSSFSLFYGIIFAA